MSFLLPAAIVVGVRWLSGVPALVLFAGGLLATLLTFPFLLTPLLPAGGAGVARVRGAAALVAGRRLQAAPPATARLLAIPGVACVTACVVLGVFSATTRDQSELHRAEPGQVAARWLDPQPGDLERVRSLLPGRRIEFIDENGEPVDADTGGSPDSRRGLGGAAIEVRSEADRARVQHVLRGQFGLADLDGPAPTLSPPMLRWIGGLLPVTFVALGGAAIVWIVGRRLRQPDSDRLLTRLGATAETSRRIVRWEFELPLVASTLLGTGIGLGFCWAGTDLRVTQLPSDGLLLLLVGSIALVLVPLEIDGVVQRIRS